jgi:membrane-associated phospholipid phosphatase
MAPLPFNLTLVQFFVDHRNVCLTKLFLGASFVGSADGYVLIAILLYVLWDKQLAIRLSVLVLLTMSLNEILKFLIKDPRPFIREGTYLKKWAVSAASAKGLAAEYSTPSGHAMGSSAFYAYLYAFINNRWVRVAAVLTIVLIGVSRPYLGVHYVEDVLLGWAFGLSIALVAAKYTGWLSSVWNKFSYGQQIGITAAVSLALFLLSMLINGWRIDAQPRDLLGFAGFLTGIVIARPLELRKVNFDPRSSNAIKKVLRYVLSMGMVLFVLLFFDRVFGAMADKVSLLGYLLQYVRYALAGIAGIFLAPLIFTRLKLAETLPARII